MIIHRANADIVESCRDEPEKLLRVQGHDVEQCHARIELRFVLVVSKVFRPGVQVIMSGFERLELIP